MAGPKSFTPSKRKRDPIPFTIALPDGSDDDYTFDPPKMASAVLPAIDPSYSSGDDEEGQVTMTQAAWGWLREGLGDEQYGRLRARLHDPDDDLDIDDTAQIVRWLMGKVSGRPTGARRG